MLGNSTEHWYLRCYIYIYSWLYIVVWWDKNRTNGECPKTLYWGHNGTISGDSHNHYHYTQSTIAGDIMGFWIEHREHSNGFCLAALFIYGIKKPQADSRELRASCGQEPYDHKRAENNHSMRDKLFKTRSSFRKQTCKLQALQMYGATWLFPMFPPSQ